VNSAVSLNLDTAVISRNNGPTYDEAYLRELKASTPNARPVVAATETEMSIDITETSLQAIDIGAGDEVYCQGVTIMHSIYESESGETTIPSESSIKVAKGRRERLRK
jgi:GC-rich sequence DNA-binding factor